VLTASNGREALAIVEHSVSDVDLILSDLTMPDMGGLELSREIKRKNLGTRIIILTGYMSDEIRKELEALEVTACLNKPIEIRHLLLAIDAALQ
jgi:CheY-like chemotaxis protein